MSRVHIAGVVVAGFGALVGYDLLRWRNRVTARLDANDRADRDSFRDHSSVTQRLNQLSMRIGGLESGVDTQNLNMRIQQIDTERQQDEIDQLESLVLTLRNEVNRLTQIVSPGTMSIDDIFDAREDRIDRLSEERGEPISVPYNDRERAFQREMQEVEDRFDWYFHDDNARYNEGTSREYHRQLDEVRSRYPELRSRRTH